MAKYYATTYQDSYDLGHKEKENYCDFDYDQESDEGIPASFRRAREEKQGLEDIQGEFQDGYDSLEKLHLEEHLSNDKYVKYIDKIEPLFEKYQEKTIQQQKTYLLQKIESEHQKHIDFQVKERESECTVCISFEFASGEDFYVCNTCQAGLCSYCSSRINRCPKCRSENGFTLISKSQDLQKEIPNRKTLREFVYDILFPKFDYNVFGHNWEFSLYQYNQMSDVAFDLELVELLRMTDEKYYHLSTIMSPKDVYTFLLEEMSWSIPVLEMMGYQLL